MVMMTNPSPASKDKRPVFKIFAGHNLENIFVRNIHPISSRRSNFDN